MLVVSPIRSMRSRGRLSRFRLRHKHMATTAMHAANTMKPPRAAAMAMTVEILLLFGDPDAMALVGNDVVVTLETVDELGSGTVYLHGDDECHSREVNQTDAHKSVDNGVLRIRTCRDSNRVHSVRKPISVPYGGRLYNLVVSRCWYNARRSSQVNAGPCLPIERHKRVDCIRP